MKQIKFFLAALFLSHLLTSCNKNLIETIQKPDIVQTKNFYNYSNVKNPIVLDIMKKAEIKGVIKNQELFVKKHGNPIWKNAKLVVSKKSVASKGTNDWDADSLILVPTVLNNMYSIQGILALGIEDGELLSKYMNYDYYLNLPHESVALPTDYTAESFFRDYADLKDDVFNNPYTEIRDNSLELGQSSPNGKPVFFTNYNKDFADSNSFLSKTLNSNGHLPPAYDAPNGCDWVALCGLTDVSTDTWIQLSDWTLKCNIGTVKHQLQPADEPTGGGGGNGGVNDDGSCLSQAADILSHNEANDQNDPPNQLPTKTFEVYAYQALKVISYEAATYSCDPNTKKYTFLTFKHLGISRSGTIQNFQLNATEKFCQVTNNKTSATVGLVVEIELVYQCSVTGTASGVIVSGSSTTSTDYRNYKTINKSHTFYAN